MSNSNAVYNDEIDLIELLKFLWKGRFIIGGAVIIGAFIAYLYIESIKTKYEVSLYYSYNFHSMEAYHFCGGVKVKLGCVENYTQKNFILAMGSGWKKMKLGNGLFFSTEEPLSSDKYIERFEKINDALTADMYKGANSEINFIKMEMNGPLLGTEIVASSLLNASRVVNSVNNGNDALSFHQIVITEKLKDNKRYYFVSFLLSIIFSVSAVVLRKVLS